MVFFLPLCLSSWLQKSRKSERERKRGKRGRIGFPGRRCLQSSPGFRGKAGCDGAVGCVWLLVLWIQAGRAGIRECQVWNLCSHLLNNCSPLVMGERVENYFWPGGRVDFLA